MAFDFHYDLVSIHPFADGNGRVSRLMMNYILVYHDQSPAIINKEDRNQYFQSLEESREIEDSTPMRKFRSPIRWDRRYNGKVLLFHRTNGCTSIFLSVPKNYPAPYGCGWLAAPLSLIFNQFFKR